MSAELRIDSEVIDAALDAWFGERGITAGIKGDVERDAMKAALGAAGEKRRELAGPEGQEYAYRVAWVAEGIMHTKPMSLEKAEQFANELDCGPWVERALLGDWERAER